MYGFLTRLGRLAVGIPVLVAILAIFGVGTSDLTPVASTSKATATCSVAMGSVVGAQQRLLVQATGLAPATSYLEAQTGVQSVMVTSDGSGSISDQSLVYHGPATYAIAFDFYFWSNHKLAHTTVASCSARL